MTEFNAERSKVYGKNCIGTEKFKKDIMISFISGEQSTFDYVDIMITNKEALKLIESLQLQIKYNKDE